MKKNKITKVVHTVVVSAAIFSMISTLFFIGMLIFLPFSAHAATSHTYVCSEWDRGGSPAPTCPAGVLTFNAGTGGAVDLGLLFNVPDSGTAYVSLHYSGSGIARMRLNSSGALDGTYVTFATDLVDEPVVAASNGGGTDNYLRLDANSAFVGNLTDICISDTIGVCGSSSGGGGMASTTNPIPTKQEELLIYGVFLFLASVPFWDRVLSVNRGRFDV